MKLSEIISRLEEKFPRQNAESWDNVGLLIGNRENEIKKIQISLDVTMKVIENAVENNVDLIISHHPFIFSPIKDINNDSVIGRKILKLIENKIAVYSLHTNLDSTMLGLNDLVGEKLGFVNGKIIDSVKENFYRGEFYSDNREKAEEELQKENISFKTEFHREETKFIFVHKKEKVYSVLEKLNRKSLMQGEYFIFELENKYTESGIGRVYSLNKKENLLDVIKDIKEKLNLENAVISGYDIEKAVIKKIAVVNGAGSSYWKKAKRMGADLLVTGDLKYHEALDAKEEGMYILDVGHYESEHFFNIIIGKILAELSGVEYFIYNDEPVLKRV